MDRTPRCETCGAAHEPRAPRCEYCRAPLAAAPVVAPVREPVDLRASPLRFCRG